MVSKTGVAFSLGIFFDYDDHFFLDSSSFFPIVSLSIAAYPTQPRYRRGFEASITLQFTMDFPLGCAFYLQLSVDSSFFRSSHSNVSARIIDIQALWNSSDRIRLVHNGGSFFKGDLNSRVLQFSLKIYFRVILLVMQILLKLVMKIENSSSKIVDVFYLRSSKIEVNLNFIREALKQLYEKVTNIIIIRRYEILPFASLYYVKFNCHPLLFNSLQGEDSKVRKFSMKRKTNYLRNFRKIWPTTEVSRAATLHFFTSRSTFTFTR